MTCQRCGGLMLRDHRARPLRMAWRCLNCGDVVDARIAAQRRVQEGPGSGAGEPSLATRMRDQNRLWSLILDKQ
jgi:hypothetical protein